MKSYVTLDENGVACGVAFLKGEMTRPDYIPEDDPDSKMGKMWTGTEWLDLPEPEPVPETVFSRLAFRTRFTFDERIAMETATHPVMLVIKGDFAACEFVDITDPRTVQAVQAMTVYPEGQPLLTPTRAQEILTP